MLRVHVEEAASAELTAGLDAIVAEGARGCWPPPSKPRSRPTCRA